ncbi:hypothetical protein M426DRAFT_9192 [Hypoxylon sp. CI-4A]|nr:hypothetical protein M426DRAFT_9192 [Hypoxylon sp. CI-4A]
MAPVPRNEAQPMWLLSLCLAVGLGTALVCLLVLVAIYAWVRRREAAERRREATPEPAYELANQNTAMDHVAYQLMQARGPTEGAPEDLRSLGQEQEQEQEQEQGWEQQQQEEQESWIPDEYDMAADAAAGRAALRVTNPDLADDSSEEFPIRTPRRSGINQPWAPQGASSAYIQTWI